MSNAFDFATAWEDYRRRRRWFYGVWLGGFLVIALLLSILSKLRLDNLAFYILGPGWIIAFILAACRVQSFRCPRCQQRFFATSWYYNSFARRCVHCGLRKWSENDLHP